jgi:hypothetical protein
MEKTAFGNSTYSEAKRQLSINSDTDKLWPALHGNYMEVSFCPSHIGSIYLKDSFHAVGRDVHGSGGAGEIMHSCLLQRKICPVTRQTGYISF